MNAPRLARWVFGKAMYYVAAARRPDVTIGGHEDPYLQRWFIIPRNRVFNVYLHRFLRSDDDRALHDHPWWNLSFLLTGCYREHTIAAGGVNVFTDRVAGDFKARWATHAHRIELTHGPCWTLFITGPHIRTWGFHCPRGWVDWRIFTNPADGGATVGRGCGEDDLTRPQREELDRRLTAAVASAVGVEPDPQDCAEWLA